MIAKRLVIATVLVAAPTPVLYAWAREQLAQRAYWQRYVDAHSLVTTEQSPGTPEEREAVGWDKVAKVTIRFGENTVVLMDQFGAGWSDSTSAPEQAPAPDTGIQTGIVRTFINAKDYTLSTPVQVRPTATGIGRYHTWLSATALIDRDAATRFLAVTQRIDPYLGRSAPWRKRSESFGFRVLTVKMDGTVGVEEFSLAERRSAPHRPFLVQQTAGWLPGYYMDSLPGWATPFDLVPFAAWAAGLLMWLAEGVSRIRRVNSGRSPVRSGRENA